MSDNFQPVLDACRERWPAAAAPAVARRLFHGRGRSYPGYEDFTVDRFGDVLLIGCFSDRMAEAEVLAELLAQAFPTARGIALQHRQGRGNRTRILHGDVPEEIVVEEAGLSYLVMPLENQNVGLFLDMAPTRRWLESSVTDARVLNLFAYTCAFSVAAVAGGAREVVNVDMSRSALEWGRRNHELNDHDLRKVRMLPHNLFKAWPKLRKLGPFNVIIIDPPTNQRGSFTAEKQYGLVLKRLPEFAAPGARIVACLNSPFLNTDFLPGQMARWCPDARHETAMPVSPDFPDLYPDRGLKIDRFRYR